MADWKAKKDGRYDADPAGASELMGRLRQRFSLTDLDHRGVPRAKVRRWEEKRAGPQAEPRLVESVAAVVAEYMAEIVNAGDEGAESRADYLRDLFHRTFTPGPAVRRPVQLKRAVSLLTPVQRPDRPGRARAENPSWTAEDDPGWTALATMNTAPEVLGAANETVGALDELKRQLADRANRWQELHPNEPLPESFLNEREQRRARDAITVAETTLDRRS